MDTKKEAQNSKRIAKNTLMLYIRTFFIMIVNLYTSRVTLDALGVDDFGIYNIIGGVVIMFSIISASLSNAITRYLTFEIGNHNKAKLGLVFSTSVNIQFLLSFLVVLLTELLGGWFLFNRMQIPLGRLNVAFWVLQFSLLTFVVQLISLPYNAIIIAHERMNVFAYVGIIEALLRLSAAYAIVISSFDKLFVYVLLVALSAIIVRVIYGCYCSKHFTECKYRFGIDKKLLKEMFGFAGWNFLGTGAYILNTQGVNIVSNVFFGVVVNAARGIAGQAENGVKQFIGNFTTALNPQIIKTYAENDLVTCFKIVRLGAKYSYILMLFFFIPFVLEADFVLGVWLKEVPEYAVLFWQLAMLGVLVDLPGAPLTTLAQATGNIKKFYIYVGGLGCVVLPVSYGLFKLGFPPVAAYIAYVVVYTYLVYVRLFLLKRQIGFPIRLFVVQVVGRIFIVTIVSFVLPLVLANTLQEGGERFIYVFVSSCISVCVSTWIIGMGNSERKKVISFVKNKYVLWIGK